MQPFSQFKYMTTYTTLLTNSNYRNQGEDPWNFTMTFDRSIVNAKKISIYQVIFPNVFPSFSEFNNTFTITQGATTASYTIPTNYRFGKPSDFVTYINTAISSAFSGDITCSYDSTYDRLAFTSASLTAFKFVDNTFVDTRFRNKIGFTGSAPLVDATTHTATGVPILIGTLSLGISCNLFNQTSLGCVNGGFQGDPVVSATTSNEGLETFDLGVQIPVNVSYGAIVNQSPNYQLDLNTQFTTFSRVNIQLLDDDGEYLTNLPTNFPMLIQFKIE